MNKKPDFPLKYLGEVNAFPIGGNKIAVPNLIATIPLFTLEEDPEQKKVLEMKYWEEKQKEYDAAVKFYESLNIGDIYWAGINQENTIRISKFSIKDDFLFINFCATKEHKKHAIKKGFKPIKPIKWQFEIFQSLVKSGKILKYSNL